MGRHKLTVPGLPPAAICETCGERNDSHNFRHPFKSSVERIDPWERIAELEQRVADDAITIEHLRTGGAAASQEATRLERELAEAQAILKGQLPAMIRYVKAIEQGGEGDE